MHHGKLTEEIHGGQKSDHAESCPPCPGMESVLGELIHSYTLPSSFCWWSFTQEKGKASVWTLSPRSPASEYKAEVWAFMSKSR